jgi:hypothetical protein
LGVHAGFTAWEEEQARESRNLRASTMVVF